MHQWNKAFGMAHCSTSANQGLMRTYQYQRCGLDEMELYKSPFYCFELYCVVR